MAPDVNGFSALVLKLIDCAVDNGHEDSSDLATECFSMNQIEYKFGWGSLLVGGLLAIASMASTGCQSDVAGQTLPSPYYLSDDLQYFPAGPEFKLSNEAAAMKRFAAEAAGEELPTP